MYTFEEIINRVPVDVEASEFEIRIKFLDGSSCLFYHEQDCCEDVFVEDVNGDWKDLLDTPLLVVEERSEVDFNASESGTFTFYTFRSVKGSVDVRWYGSSNGYYSEAVNFEFTGATA